MKVTKLGHSCVLVEDLDKRVLFDPGGWADKSLIAALAGVDFVVYTHEHADHFDVALLRSLIEKFPRLQVVCNEEIQQILRTENIQVEMAEETEEITKFASPHESLPLPNVPAPAENGYHFADFTHVGDSQSFSETRRVLAMPFIGPWGKTGDSIAKVLDLKPAYVLPIHDWHYTEEAKQWLQGLLEHAFAGSGIELLANENGKEIEIRL